MAAEDAFDHHAQSERDFFAQWGVNPAGDKLRWQREFDLLRRARPGGLGSVLSLGCGRGWFETLLAEHADHVLGIDLSPESVRDARSLATQKGCGNVEFLCADVSTFELDRRFDTIICVAFLHHLTDSECLNLLVRIHRHLNAGGLLHTQDPNVHGLLRKVGRIVLGSRYDEFHTDDERELDPTVVSQMFLEAGFESAEPHYMDFCLIPGMQLFPTAPAWTMRSLAAVDRAWCSLPVARWASGFSIDAIR